MSGKQSEICIVGSAEFVEPFRATGVAVYPVEERNLKEVIETVIKKDFKIIFYEENIYPFIQNKEQELKGRVFPSFVPLPSIKTKERLATKRLKELIKRAVGIEIYWEEK